MHPLPTVSVLGLPVRVPVGSGLALVETPNAEKFWKQSIQEIQESKKYRKHERKQILKTISISEAKLVKETDPEIVLVLFLYSFRSAAILAQAAFIV